MNCLTRDEIKVMRHGWNPEAKQHYDFDRLCKMALAYLDVKNFINAIQDDNEDQP